MINTDLWAAFEPEAAVEPMSAPELAQLTLETWQQAVIFVGANDLGVFWLNEAAKRCLRSFAHLVGGRIQLTQRRHQKALDNFILDTGISHSSWILDLPEGPGTLVFRCRALAGTQYKVLCIFSLDNPSTHLPDVGKLLGLTPSESRVILGLVDGRRADALAQDLGVSVETVRTHIRRIYFKTGVNSREQLIAKVSAFRTP